MTFVHKEGSKKMSANIFVPLNQPLYGATFGQAVSRFFQKYATFSGRASRSEFWWVQLFIWLVSLVPAILVSVGMGSSVSASGDVAFNGVAIFGLILSFIIGLGLLVPSLAITWRRLHDANMSGWFYLLILVPGVGSIIIFILMMMPSNPMGVRFDTN